MADSKFENSLNQVVSVANGSPQNDTEKDFIRHLRNLLDGLIEHKKLIDGDDLKYMIRVANEIEVDISHSWKIANGRTKRMWQRNPLNALRLHGYPDFPHGISKVVMRLLENLPDNENSVKKLKRCPYCQDFFIAKDTKRLKCYSEACRKEYERRKKHKQRDDDPAKYV